MKKLLLATALTFLAAAAPAQAGWMTGNGNPPVYSTDDACRNGMTWSYLTFTPGVWPPPPGVRDIHAHWVSIESGPRLDPPDPALRVAFSPTIAIPWAPRVLPATFNLIGAGIYPFQVNRFDFSRDVAINFNRRLAFGTPLRLQWHEPNSNIAMYAAHRYRVANCWYGIVRSRYELAFHLGSLELVEQLKPRKWYQEGSTLLLVFDDALQAEPGQRIRIEPVK
jgi:hypothetical protein